MAPASATVCCVLATATVQLCFGGTALLEAEDQLKKVLNKTIVLSYLGRTGLVCILCRRGEMARVRQRYHSSSGEDLVLRCPTLWQPGRVALTGAPAL